MPVELEWDLRIDADQVLRGQGADPTVIRQRSPRLVDLAERAIEEGTPLLKPAMLYLRWAVEGIRHESIHLEGGAELQGKLVAQHLAPARELLVILCTIGAELEEKISQVTSEDLVYGLALDGLGSAGVEALANAGCRRFEMEAVAAGFETSIPLSPGMLEWPVEQGQPQIFGLLQEEDIGVSLTPTSVMVPRKSLSMVIGIGESMVSGTTCDYCGMRATCRYQDHYA